jgi:beta-phosphoglucomutase
LLHGLTLPSVDAVIFDFDETMINLEEQHTVADDRLCQVMGNRYSDMPESFRLSSGQRIIDNIREMRRFFGWTKSEAGLFEMRQRFFDEACASGDLELMPGVERVVRELHAEGLPLAITSSAVRSGIETILRRFDLLDCFTLIVDGSEVRHGKPDPEAYQLTARKLGVPARRCLVFEDSTIGVAAAKAAGMFCVAVRNPSARQPQDLNNADVVVESFEAISSPRGRSAPQRA